MSDKSKKDGKDEFIGTARSSSSKLSSKMRGFIAAGFLGTFAAGLLIGRLIIPTGNVDTQSPFANNSEVTSDSASISQSTDINTSNTYDFQNIRAENAPRAKAVQNEIFGYRRLVLDTSQASPEACFQFSRELDDSGSVNYGDYVRVTPDFTPAISVNKNSLCIGGLSFDKEYSAELRAGLPAVDGSVLTNGESITITFGDKPAYVGFSGNGVILPRLEADGLGVETVNLDRIKLTIRRVSDRSLFRNILTKGEATSADQYSFNYGATDGRNGGVIVWEGEVETKGEANQLNTTVFPLGAALKDLKPGAYYLEAEDASLADKPNERKADAWRWILYTDMAMTSYRGSDGIDVFIRSIATARPLVGVEMVLIAANNEILAKATSNADGRVHFDQEIVEGPQTLAPKMVMAYGTQDDFAVLPLTKTPLDLSERNIGGRAAPPLIDGFVYLDRDIYRPGEKVNLSALIRDDTGRAVTDRSVTLKILRPNGTLAEEKRITQTQIGGFTTSYDISASASRGIWRATLSVDGVDGIVGNHNFSVEDFVPQRLEVTLDIDEETPLKQQETRSMVVESRYLYGAPASGLTVESELRYRVDPKPFANHKGYSFGPAKSPNLNRFQKLPNSITDGEGKTVLSIKGSNAPVGLAVPMRADIVIGVVEPGGRVVRESAFVPVRQETHYVGVKLVDDKTSFSRTEDADLQAVLLNSAGEPQQGELEWRLVREDYWFDWYQSNGRWRWKRSFRDILVAEGRGNTDVDGLLRVSRRLESGEYRLAVWKAGETVKSEKQFYVGWRSYGGGADTPDQAVLSADQEKIMPGTRARLFLKPPYGGEATIVVATDKVHLVQRIKVEEEGREIIIDTDPSWGSGFYVMATIVTPRDAVTRPIPRRAMGVHYVPFDMQERTLTVKIDGPEILRPRQTLNLPVSIDGLSKGEDVMMTIAAVDEGILRITKFTSPDPVKYFYGKKRLDLSIHDDYGRILNANLGAPIRFGGDQIGGEGLTVVPTKSVALFSGLIKVDENGKAVIPIEVPDFNGELRLMAVAWSAEKIGKETQPLTVRDRVPAQLSLSRFLAPDDISTATLLIDNVDGEAGDYTVKITGSEPLSLDETMLIPLEKGEKQTREIKLTAQQIGIGNIALAVTGPDDFSVSRNYPIQVRSPWFPLTQSRTITQAPGESFALSEALLSDFTAGSGEITLSYSRLNGIEPGPLLDSLYRYPYGCSEQLTSSSFPLLYVDKLGGEIGRGPERAIRPRVQKAINKLLDRQSPDGAIGLWRVGDRYGSGWLGAYITDFLYRAKQEGYGVPEHSLNLSYDAITALTDVTRYVNVGYITRVANETSTDSTQMLRLRSAAYAHYVLTRAGRGKLSDIRYFHDSLMAQTNNPLAKAHIGAALAIFDDRARADKAFRQALKGIGFDNSSNYYQTPLRDAGGVVALIAESGYDHLLEQATQELTKAMKEPSRMHTQEKAYVLMAANGLLKNAGPLAVSLNDEVIEGLSPSPVFNPSADDIQIGNSYKNNSDAPVFLSITTTGSPKQAPTASGQGMTVSKRITDRQGKAVDLNSIRQNDRLVVVISGKVESRRTHPLIIADLLPAGFEIETILQPKQTDYKWVGDLDYTRVTQARDDRFVAAIDVHSRKAFKLAYIVRAITPGDYTIPGTAAEDMYRPGVFARTTAQSMKISSASE